MSVVCFVKKKTENFEYGPLDHVPILGIQEQRDRGRREMGEELRFAKWMDVGRLFTI
jgi:hypothetical protein